MKPLQVISGAAILGLLVAIAVTPTLAYAPVPRVILFLLAACFPALLFASTAATKLQLTARGFLFASSGATAFFLALLLVLSHLAKPELQVIAFEVIDEAGRKVPLNTSYGLSLDSSAGGLTANHFVKGNTALLVFPEQLVEQRVTVRLAPDHTGYTGTVSYARPPKGPLQIGKELR